MIHLRAASAACAAGTDRAAWLAKVASIVMEESACAVAMPEWTCPLGTLP
jgi:hypothetical protein